MATTQSRDTSRAQSSLIGSVLLVGLVIVGTVGVATIGAIALTDVRENAQATNAENVMTQFDSRASQVAFGASPVQRVPFDGAEDEEVAVDDDAGRIVIEHVDDDGTETVLVDEQFGAVEYESGETTVAYQGGGVWRHEAGGTTMVSVPEFQYNSQTLTFPIVRVTGESLSSERVQSITVEDNGTERVFPNPSQQNPVDDGKIVVEITSAYHQGWSRYFESRTEGNVEHDPANETVTVSLTIPVTESFQNAVTATSNDTDAISTSGNAAVEGPTETGVSRPAPDLEIDQRISDCESGSCPDLTDELSDGVVENGTYYEDGDVTLTRSAFDTSNGAVEVVVDGSVTFTGTTGPGNEDHTVTGGGDVTFYVKGNVSIGGNAGVNTDGAASNFRMMVHSDAGSVAAASGTPQYTGIIYAPGSTLEINGGGACGASGNGNNGNSDSANRNNGNGNTGNGNTGNTGASDCEGNIVGAVIVEEATASGNGKLTYDSTMDVTVEFEAVNGLTFLHVTENRIDVDGG